jgi:type IV secretion system protein VirB10
MPNYGPTAMPTPQVDTSAARARQAWLDRPGATGADDYLQATLQPPLSPYEIKAGTPIQAKMVGGVSSDAPGLITGQVTENVYDTATGRWLLIPQGARLVGTYDSSIVNGQSRVVVGWNRIIFPDGWSIAIGNMPGADEGGYAGFHDQVNTHFWSKIGNALLITVAGAAAQLSQPQAGRGEDFNPTQILAASLGQQFAILGQMYAQAGLAIPPTLEIRPGYPFVVMVRKDMVLQPYVDHRTPHGTVPVSIGSMMQ